MNEQVEEVQVEDTPEVSQETLAEASRFGWVPKEKFRGNEADWVDAETFVERGRAINPILKANNERLKHEIDELRSKLEESSLSVKEFKKFQQEAFDRREQEYKAQIDSLKTQKKEAIELGDGGRVIEIDDQLDEIKEAQRQTKEIKEDPKPEVKPDPVFLSWLEDNSWYAKDKKLTAVADAIANEITEEGRPLGNLDFLEEVSRRVKIEMPHKFEQEKRRVSNVEGSSSTRSNKPSKKSYETLPADAKAACDDFVKRGFITREEYVAKYNWE